MAKTPSTDAQEVLEQLRASTSAGQVSATLLQSIYAIEHEKQFEEERGPVEVALRDLIIAAVTEPS